MYTAAGMSDDEEDSDEGFSFGSALHKNPVAYAPQPVDIRTSVENELFKAIEQGDLCGIQKALNNNVGVTLETPLQGNWTALMHACSRVNIPVAKFLLQAGCPVNSHISLFTPLMAACSTSNNIEENVLTLVKLLLQNGANIHLADAHGTTALMLACQIGYQSVVSELLAHRARVNHEDNQGRTALFWAVNENHYKICSLLIEKNCAIDLQDSRGMTAMQLASVKGFTDIIELLESCISGKKPNSYWAEARELIGNNSWRSNIPGIAWCGMEEPSYYSDVDALLNGMEMEHLVPDILHQRISLSEFLQMADDKLENIGVILPFERRVILTHLKWFHIKKWSKNSISRPRSNADFDIFNFLIQISSHYKHILTIYSSMCALNMNYKLQSKPVHSERINQELKRAFKALRISINDFKHELKNAKTVLYQISKRSEKPVDFIDVEAIHANFKSRFSWCNYTLLFIVTPITIAYLLKNMT